MPGTRTGRLRSMPQSKTSTAAPSAQQQLTQECRWLRCGSIGAPHGTQGALFCIMGGDEARPLPYTRALLIPPSKLDEKETCQEILVLCEKKGSEVATSHRAPPLDASAPLDHLTGASQRRVMIAETLPGSVHRVKRSFLSGGRVVAQFEAITDRSVAETHRGWLIFIDAAEVELDEDETLVADLLQCEVQCPPGVSVGRVVAVHNFGAQPTLEIAPHKGKATVYFPYLTAFVMSHDVQERVIVVRDFDAFAEGTP